MAVFEKRINIKEIEERSSFLKKRTKRPLVFRRSRDRGHGRDFSAGAGIKVFCFFSSEKKTLLKHIAAHDRGFALLIVLWAMVLLALLGTQVTGAGRAETRLATALRSGAQLQEAADAAVYETIWHMLDGGGDYWPPGAMIRVLDEPAGRVVVKVTDDRGKFDINQVPPGFLQSLFSMLGADKDTATTVANAVTDWRSQQPGGAGIDSPLIGQYRSAGRVWGPSGSEFQRLDDLNLVLGMTPALVKAARPYLTLALEQGPWLKYASPVVLAAMEKAKHDSGLTIEDADARGPVVLSIEARAVGSNGAAFTRRVLFRLDGTLSGPAWRYRILSWENGPAA